MGYFRKAPPAKVDEARVDFDQRRFERLIGGHGLRVRWSQSIECPCYTPGTRLVGAGASLLAGLEAAGETGANVEARPDCAACGGDGYVYHHTQEIRAGFTSARGNPRMFAGFGVHALETAMFTVLPEHPVSFMDRLEMVDAFCVYKVNRLRGSGVVDTLRHPVAVTTVELDDGLAGAARCRPFSVIYALKSSADGDVDPAGVLAVGTDFSVNSDGAIDWSLGDGLGSAPAEGQRYSLAYFGHPSYYAINAPHSIRNTWVKLKQKAATQEELPIQVYAQREHLGGRA